MSFRIRVLALVSVVALTAIGATAYLAYRQASQQVANTVTADRVSVSQVVAGLADYARRHGTWYGSAATVKTLGDRTGQRIVLVDDSGKVMVDTDVLAGHEPRGRVGAPSTVDARPVLDVSSDQLRDPHIADAVVDIIRNYRAGVRLADCLTRHRVAVSYTVGPFGVPSYAPGDAAEQGEAVADCVAQKAGLDQADQAAANQALNCRPGRIGPPTPNRSPGTGRSDPLDQQAACLARAFVAQTADVAPATLLVYLGAAGEPAATSLPPGPVALAAALVALLALVGTALVSRRMLRPIAALTTASYGLGEGDLSRRVPVRGRDELAQLAQSFNRMAESLQHGEERQRRMVADVAHELRTPLANLRGYLEALKDGVVEPSPELFASLHEEAVLQQRIVNDLQDLALAEAGALTYHRSGIDLVELLETCRTTHQAAAEAAGVALVVRTRGRIVLHADPDRLRQAFGNLISNALKATPAGGSVTLESTRSAEGRAVVVVRDTGRGIAPADLPHIFDRFWRADGARGRGTGGSGLGLAITRQIITDHSGQITVESQLGHGTLVTVTLPRTAPEDGGAVVT